MKKIIFAAALFFSLATPCHALSISGEAGVIIAADTNEIIYEKNSERRLPMASTTKIMTAIVALENSAPDEEVTVSANAERQEGSSIYLRRGDKIRMEDLLYGLMLNSGNDAAVAVAEYISGNVEGFSLEMNRLAEKIGANNSSFKNPNGLFDAEHYTTAYDLAKITAYAMRNDDFKKIVSAKEKSAKINNSEVLYFHNHNKLLKMYEGSIGVKTGFTKRSGRCLVSAAERNGVTLIAVTLNAPDDWNDHIKMLDYGFSKCATKEILAKNQPLKSLNTESGEQIDAVLGEGISVTAIDGKAPPSEVKLHIAERLGAPIFKGEKIGEAEVYVGGRLYSVADLLAGNDVTKSRRSAGEAFLRVLKKWRNCYLQSK